MEDVGPILMHMDALHLKAMDIAPCMGTLVDDKAALSSLTCFAGKEGTKEAGTYNQVVVVSLLSHVRWHFFVVQSTPL